MTGFELFVIVMLSVLVGSTVAQFLDAYHDPAPHMLRGEPEAMPHDVIVCDWCGKGAEACAPTLSEVYDMLAHWCTVHACTPTQIPTTTGGN